MYVNYVIVHIYIYILTKGSDPLSNIVRAQHNLKHRYHFNESLMNETETWTIDLSVLNDYTVNSFVSSSSFVI